MKMLIDTNRYTDFSRNVPDVVARFVEADELFVPFAVIAELRAGFKNGTILSRNENALVRFLGNPKVQMLFPDLETTNIYANIFAQLRRQGTPIPTHDMWIASLAIQYSLPVFTRDNHFKKLPQLTLL